MSKLLAEHSAIDLITAILDQQPEDEHYIIAETWTVNDVMTVSKVTSTEQAIAILNDIQNNYDANVGIAWGDIRARLGN